MIIGTVVNPQFWPPEFRKIFPTGVALFIRVAMNIFVVWSSVAPVVQQNIQHIFTTYMSTQNPCMQHIQNNIFLLTRIRTIPTKVPFSTKSRPT